MTNNSKNNFKSIELVVNFGKSFKKVSMNNLMNSPSGLLIKTSVVSFSNETDKSGKPFKPVVTIQAENGKTIELSTGTKAAYLQDGLSCIFTIKGGKAQWYGETGVSISIAVGYDDEVNERLSLLAEYDEIMADIKAVFGDDKVKSDIAKAKLALVPFNRAV